MTPEMKAKLENECPYVPACVNRRRAWLEGAHQAYEFLLAEMAGQDVEKAAFKHSLDCPHISGECLCYEGFLAGDAHGYARAKGEIDEIKAHYEAARKLISKVQEDRRIAVKSERERIWNRLGDWNGLSLEDAVGVKKNVIDINPSPSEGENE